MSKVAASEITEVYGLLQLAQVRLTVIYMRRGSQARDERGRASQVEDRCKRPWGKREIGEVWKQKEVLGSDELGMRVGNDIDRLRSSVECFHGKKQMNPIEGITWESWQRRFWLQWVFFEQMVRWTGSWTCPNEESRVADTAKSITTGEVLPL